MAQINVSVNGKTYPLVCAEGDQERLTKLATYVNDKCKDLTSKLGHVAENRLLLMAAVLIADELHDSMSTGGGPGLVGGLTEADMATVLNEVAAEVEGITDRLSAG
ncbi:cell division protein ZapA [Kordiimonas aestuarii]|uniref:cell division protein ZapA n=1 Tax=Kordiimonas aestuarii TaxID=1005925 RepID=UPI0021D2717C|nr:cell division protein ZapA [Kordiimonas aestuarii]